MTMNHTRVSAYLTALADGPLTIDEVAAITNTSRRRVRDELACLAQAGVIKANRRPRAAEHKRGSGLMEYRLPELGGLAEAFNQHDFGGGRRVSIYDVVPSTGNVSGSERPDIDSVDELGAAFTRSY